MIGIIGAMRCEVDGLINEMESVSVKKISSVDFYSGKLCGMDVVVAEAGVGKVNAAVTAQTMILSYGVDCLINSGVAGGLDPALGFGDVCIADRTAEHDMDTTPLGDDPGFITGLDRIYMECDKEVSKLLYDCTKELGINVIMGTIVSGDQFIATNDQRKKLIELFGASAAEMEGASIGHVCAMNDIKYAVLRAISDGANDDSSMDFPAFCQMAADNAVKIIKAFLKKYNDDLTA